MINKLLQVMPGYVFFKDNKGNLFGIVQFDTNVKLKFNMNSPGVFIHRVKIL